MERRGGTTLKEYAPLDNTPILKASSLKGPNGCPEIRLRLKKWRRTRCCTLRPLEKPTLSHKSVSFEKMTGKHRI